MVLLHFILTELKWAWISEPFFWNLLEISIMRLTFNLLGFPLDCSPFFQLGSYVSVVEYYFLLSRFCNVTNYHNNILEVRIVENRTKMHHAKHFWKKKTIYFFVVSCYTCHLLPCVYLSNLYCVTNRSCWTTYITGFWITEYSNFDDIHDT